MSQGVQRKDSLSTFETLLNQGHNEYFRTLKR